MNKDNSAFESIWEQVIEPSIRTCKSELDAEFKKEANLYILEMETYKEKLKKMVKALTFAIFCSIIEMVEIIN